MAVGDFYDDLRRTLARGSSLEQNLVPWTVQALKFLERNNTFTYMRDTYFLVPNAGVTYFDLALPRIKTVEMLGYFGQGAGIIPITKINRQSLGAFVHTRPAGFWLERGRLYFEGSLTPAGQSGSYPLIMRTAQFSQWPTSAAADHPILAMADDLLKYQVMVQQAPALRAGEQLAEWKLQRDEALQSVIRLQEEDEKEDTIAMEYRGGTGRLYPDVASAISAIRGLYAMPAAFGAAGLYHVGP